ncbi:MAG: transposase [Acetobacteraceae bacterium]|nr:transposase [Acetobacteraceae bacterium]
MNLCARRASWPFAAYVFIQAQEELACNLTEFLRTRALPDEAAQWLLTTLRGKLVKIGAKVIHHGRCVAFQLAEVAVPRHLFGTILSLIARLRAPPTPA